jgi:hypothetical protein
MTLLSVVKDVCAVVGVALPQSVFSAVGTNRTMQEMLALAGEMAQRIAYDTRDWTKFRTTASYDGDGVSTAFDLPADYKRMLLTSNVWRSTSTLTPMRFVPDTDEWLQRRSRHHYNAWGEWTLLGDKILIAPVMGIGVSAYYPYLHRNCIALAGGGVSDSFQADDDRFALDERVLKLGMIWQWKAQKGSPYNEDLGTYEDALRSITGRDNPAPILLGRAPLSAAIRAAYPPSVGLPT